MPPRIRGLRLNALKELPVPLQKEGCFLLGEHCLVNRDESSSVYGKEPSALRDILEHFLPFLKETGISPANLFDATFADLPRTFTPGQFWLQRVEGGHGKAADEQVNVLDEFVTAFHSGNILTWVVSGSNRAGRRQRTLEITSHWGKTFEAVFIEKVAANPVEVMPPTGGMEMIEHRYTLMSRKADVDELVAAFKNVE